MRMPSGSSIHIPVKPRGPAEDGDSGRGQPGVLGADIPHLDPDPHRVPARTGRGPGDLQQSRPGEEHHTGIVWGAELPADGRAKDVAVEAAAAVQAPGADENPAAHNVHTTIPASR